MPHDLLRHRRQLPVVFAAPPPRIDGRLDDAIWQRTAPVGMIEWNNGGPVSHPTRVKVAYDHEHLYLAYDVAESSRTTIVPGDAGSHDSLSTSAYFAFARADYVELYLQPQGQGHDFFRIAVNPAGGTWDARYTADGIRQPWTCKALNAQAKPDGQGYGVEIAIPLTSLNAPAPQPGTIWRADLGRVDRPGDAESVWNMAFFGPMNQHRMGEFVFMHPDSTPAGPIETRKLTGTVTDEAGKPMARVRVRTAFGQTRTDDAGRFTLHGLPPGPVRIYFYYPRYLPVLGYADVHGSHQQPQLEPQQLEPIVLRQQDAYRPAYSLKDEAGEKVSWWASSVVEPPDMRSDAALPAQAGPLDMLAAPGQYESAAVTLYAHQATDSPRVTATSLAGKAGKILADRVRVRWTQRLIKRMQFSFDREDAVYRWRFLRDQPPARIEAGHLRQLVVTVQVPEDAAPGVYRGTLELRRGDPQVNPQKDPQRSMQADDLVATLPLELTVPDLTLVEPAKRVGVYYRATLDPEQIDRELQDIKAHGGSVVIWLAHAGVSEDAGKLSTKLSPVQAMVRVQQSHGFEGPYFVHLPMRQLQRMSGITGAGQARADQIRASAALKQKLTQVLAELDELQDRIAPGKFAYIWADEVTWDGENRLPPWLAEADLVAAASDTPIYITLHNRNVKWVRQIAQRADLLSFLGEIVDEEIGEAGQTMAEIRAGLERWGDQGWTYYNIFGVREDSEIVRLAHGYWLWQSPFAVNAPWTYHSFGGSPFDDLDHRVHDFAYAVPHPSEPRMVSTLHWEAYRQGYNDLRYLATLEAAIARASNQQSQAVARARALLESLRAGDVRAQAQAARLKAQDYRERRQAMARLIEAIGADASDDKTVR